MSATPDDVLAGRARWCVVVGDALDLVRSLPDGAVDAIVSDPPYASTGDAASLMVREGAPKEIQFYEAWAREHLREWLRVMGPKGAAWFTCDWRGAMAFDMSAHRLGCKPPVVGVWDRGGLGMGHVLRKVWEAFVVVQGAEFVRRRADEPDLWRHEWRAAHRSGLHGAEKPIALVARAVRLVSDPGAVVLDPFAGSGTTGEAAIREGRRAILFERDPEFAAIAAGRCEAAVDGRDWRRPEQGALFGVAS